MSRGWVTGWLIAGLLVVSPGRASGQSTGGPSEQVGDEIPTFLEEFRWVERGLTREGPSQYPMLYRAKGTGDTLAVYAGTLRRYDPDSKEWVEVITATEEKCGRVVSDRFFETSQGTVLLEAERDLLVYVARQTGVTPEEVKAEEPKESEKSREPRSLLSGFLEVVSIPVGAAAEVLLIPVKAFGELLRGPGLKVTSFCETSDGVLWFGTEGNGLRRCVLGSGGEGEPAVWADGRTFSTKSDLPSNNITGLAVGPYNTVWVGTDKGLVVWRGEKCLSTPRVDKELTQRVRFLHRAGAGRLWVGTDRPRDALFVVGGEGELVELILRARSSNPGNDYIYDMPFETSSGELWLRRTRCNMVLLGIREKEQAGLLRVVERDGSFRFQAHSRHGAEGDSADGTAGGLVGDWVKAMAEDGDGRLWVACKKGVSVFDPEAERWFTILSADGKSPIGGSVPDPPKLRSVAVAADGSVWFGGKNVIYGLKPRTVGASRQ